MRPPSVNAHWRDSARPAMFFGIDSRAAFPIFFWLMHLRLWTFILALVATAFFAVLNRYGFTPIVFGRWLRSTLAGRRKMSAPWWL